ncbi:MAG: DMT family transporter [Patescibacteria group bacterium]|jgi:drug/metabolite transporter (DMT)-like permease
MWLLFAFSSPVLWAVSTHIDKYLVEKYFKNSSTAVLMVFTSLIGLVALPFIWLHQPQVLALPRTAIAVMMASGILYMGAMLLYLQAIQTEEASVVAPLFQASAVWGGALAYFLLGEKLTPAQLAGGAIVLVAGAILSLDKSMRFGRIKIGLVLRMGACTLALALSSVIFKYFAVNDEFWSTVFWTFAGEAVLGMAIMAIPAYARQMFRLLRASPAALLAVNGTNELINLGGGLGARYALMLAPVALVQAIVSTTTLFVFLFGVLITVFWPSLGREDLSRRNLLQKGAGAVLVAVGVALINS